MNGYKFVTRSGITVRNSSLFDPGVKIYDSEFNEFDPCNRHLPGKTVPLIIGDRVWIGLGVMILSGIRIGSEAVVAAGVLFTQNVQTNSIALDNPKSVIR